MTPKPSPTTTTVSYTHLDVYKRQVYAASAPPEVTRVLADRERTALPDLRVAPGDRLVLPNCSDLTWASIDFDEATLAALPARLGELADPLARSVCWQSLDDGVARGVVDPCLLYTSRCV